MTNSTETIIKKQIVSCPTRKQLQDIYSNYSANFIKKIFEGVRRDYPLTYGNPNGLTTFQFSKVIEEIGLPIGVSEKDLPF